MSLTIIYKSNNSKTVKRIRIYLSSLRVLNDNLFNNTKILFGICNIAPQFLYRGEIRGFDFFDTLSALSDVGLCKEEILAFYKLFKPVIINFCNIENFSAHKLCKFLVKKIFLIKYMRKSEVIKSSYKLFVFHSGKVSFSFLSIHIIELKNYVVIISCTVFNGTAYHIKKKSDLVFTCFFVYHINFFKHFFELCTAQNSCYIFYIHNKLPFNLIIKNQGKGVLTFALI